MARLAREYWAFLASNKWLWLGPILAVLLAVALLWAYDRGPSAHFSYTLF